MDFSHFLSSHILTRDIGGKQLYRDMLGQAVHAETCGYRGVSIPEHHLINILLVPSPLQLAVKVAALTGGLEISTSICQLPLRDMRVFAGEVVQAQALCEGRLVLGVGKGAFGFETGRIGVPMEETKPIFEESLAVLEALLSREEVAWTGKYYNFAALTVMPRPEDPIPLALAIMAPPGIEAAAAKGYSIQTTPLGASHEILKSQVNAFHEGRARAGTPPRQRLSLQRTLWLAATEAEADEMVARAHRYYESFDNVFGGPGLVDHGMIRPLPRRQGLEELRQNVLICTEAEMIDHLADYAMLGIDEVIASSNFGQPQEATLEMMSRFSERVMPAIRDIRRKVA